MNKTYSVTATREEYIEFLCYQFGSSKTMRGYRWFIRTSVPAVLITGAILLHIRSGLFLTSLIAVAGLWILYGAKAVWKRFIKRKVRNQILPKMDVKDFREVVYHFTENGIEYTENRKKVTIFYQNILAMVPLESQFVIHHAQGAVLMPYRIFADEAEMKQFVKDLEIARNQRNLK